MTIATAAAIAIGAVVYLGAIVLLCHFVAINNGDIDNDDNE